MAENIVGKNARTQAESIPKDTKFVSDTLKGMLFNNLVNGGSRGRDGSGGNSGGGRPKSMQEYHNEDVRAQHDFERLTKTQKLAHEHALEGLTATGDAAQRFPGRAPKAFKYNGLETSWEDSDGVKASMATSQQQKPKKPRRGKAGTRKAKQFNVYQEGSDARWGVATSGTPDFGTSKPAKRTKSTVKNVKSTDAMTYKGKAPTQGAVNRQNKAAASYITKSKTKLTPEQKSQNAAARTYITKPRGTKS